VESRAIFDLIEVERLSGAEDGRVLGEIAVVGIVKTVYTSYKPRHQLQKDTAVSLTVNEFAGQHLDLPGPLAPMAQVLCRDQRISSQFLLNIPGIVISFRPEHSIVGILSPGTVVVGSPCEK
jgi:hypothetical protein